MKKVIVQDTDLDLLETLTIVLKEAGFEVFPVLHYNDVVKNIDQFSPDLILLDFKLAGEQCIRLCQQLKKTYPDLPIIALSCNLNIKNEYAKTGFDNYIEKPFDLVHLITVVKSAVLV